MSLISNEQHSKHNSKTYHKHLRPTSSLNKTNSDSLTNIILHNDYKSRTASKKMHTAQNNKNLVFYQALQLIQKTTNDNQKRKTSISEFSETNVHTSKEVNVYGYVKNPVIKTIFKNGNDIIKVPQSKPYSINPPYKMNVLFSNLMGNIVEIEDDDDDEHNKQIKRRERNSKEKDSTTINTGNRLSHERELINDLDEERELNMKDYVSKTKIKNDFVNEVNEKEDDDAEREESFHEIEQFDTNGEKIYIVDEIIDVDYQELNNEEDKQGFIKKLIFDDIDEEEENNIMGDKFNDNNNGFNYNSNNNNNINICKSNCDKNINNAITIDNEEEYNNSNFVVEKIKFDTESSNNNESLLSSFVDDNKRNNNNNSNNMHHTPVKQRKPFVIFQHKANNNNNNKSIRYNNNNNTKHKHNKSYQYKNIHHLHSYYHQQTKSITSFSSMLSFNNPNIYMNNILLNNDNNNVSQNDNQDEEDNAVYDVTFLNNLIQHNNKYKITKELILSNKPSITPTIRAKAYNTLMQLCEEFAFKRETYFLAVFNCDRCLSMHSLNDISLRDFHLIALTSLALSAKIEEVQIPKLIEYTSTFPEYSFTLSDIILMEQTIMTQLNWNSIPNTMNTWLSWHICQWDLFIDSVDGIKELLYQNKDNNTNTVDETVYFKKKDDVSYYNYRRITQLIDLFSLDIESLNYNVQYLVVCAILFVLIETKHCDGNCDNDNAYMKVFQRFVCESFGEDVYGSDEFRNVMEYCLNMKGVEFVFDLPLIYQVEECEIEKGSYEEFITYQTTNEHLLEYLLKTKRLV